MDGQPGGGAAIQCEVVSSYARIIRCLSCEDSVSPAPLLLNICESQVPPLVNPTSLSLNPKNLHTVEVDPLQGTGTPPFPVLPTLSVEAASLLTAATGFARLLFFQLKVVTLGLALGGWII